MGSKIAVIVMLIITALMLVYLLILAFTGGKKEKLNFRSNYRAKRQQEIDRGIISREDRKKEKEELRQVLKEKKAEQKRNDAEYDAQVKQNIKVYKQEYLETKTKLAQVKQEYLDAKAKFEVWAKENPNLVVEDDELKQAQIMED